jgi:hypothetical protein
MFKIFYCRFTFVTTRNTQNNQTPPQKNTTTTNQEWRTLNAIKKKINEH